MDSDYASIECTEQYDITQSYIVLFGAFDGSIVYQATMDSSRGYCQGDNRGSQGHL